ncbi:MAG: secondary thiamine-phosphate synthase enzyme YjbQ [Minisyncoccales bacterium]
MFSFQVNTKGHNDIIDLTERVGEIIKKAKIEKGLALIFCPGSTVGLTTIEYEPNLLRDLQEFLEKIVPNNQKYYHDETWGERNGFAHLRSALFKPFFVVAVENSQLVLGQWQNIVLIDFDARPRQREIFVKLVKD